MCELNIINSVNLYSFDNQDFRVIGSYDKPQFIVKDICKILGLSNPTTAVKSIPDEWRGELSLIEDTTGRKQNMLTVYEPGLYHLIMRSDKPIAKKFQKWTFEEVLPSIRKSGEYVLQELKDKLEKQRLEMQEKEEENLDQQKIIKSLENRVCRSQKRVQYKERNVIYIVADEYHKKEGIYVIGKALNLTERLSDYNKVRNFSVIYYRECNSAKLMNLIEICVLYKLDKYREVKNRDRFVLPINEDISLFIGIINLFIDIFHDVDSSVDIQQDKNDIKKAYNEDNKEIIEEKRIEYYEDNKETLALVSDKYKEKKKKTQKKYYEENKEKIKEYHTKYNEENKDCIDTRNKEYYEENKEKCNKLNKLYVETHKEEISKMNKKWLENNKEYVKDQRKEFYEENKDNILNNAKEYYQENKEKIKNNVKEYYQENKEKIRIHQTEKILCECGITLQRNYLNKHLKTEIHKIGMKHKENGTKPPSEENKISCECGMKITKSCLSRHKKSKIHTISILK
jgi:prophage antirepressor-like protein